MYNAAFQEDEYYARMADPEPSRFLRYGVLPIDDTVRGYEEDSEMSVEDMTTRQLREMIQWLTGVSPISFEWNWYHTELSYVYEVE